MQYAVICGKKSEHLHQNQNYLIKDLLTLRYSKVTSRRAEEVAKIAFSQIPTYGSK